MSKKAGAGLVLAACLLLSGGWQADAGGGKKGAKSHEDLGLTEVFEAEVRTVGEISTGAFAKRYRGTAKYLPKMRWDPTKAKFWNRVALDPNAPGATITVRGREALRELTRKNPNFRIPSEEKIRELTAKRSALGLYDFRLQNSEYTRFKRNGFVVSERMGAHSFTDLYYRIYVRDLPVFVTSDSMLHAWHRFYDRLLEDVEASHFRPTMVRMLAKMAAEIPAAKKAYGNSPLADSLADVDFFLTVAIDLLQPGSGKSVLGQNGRVRAARRACENEQMQRYNLFGRVRTVDFSQFKPRGRYDQHQWSKDYFRAMMWLGRIDFRIAGTDDHKQEQHELAAAVVLNDLLTRSKMHRQWHEFDRLLQHLVGRTDSMNFSQLGQVLNGFNAPEAARFTAKTLDTLHKKVQTGKIAKQHIRGHWFCVDPFTPEKFVLPRTFAFMGQRFVLDSWLLSKVVYDDIQWQGEKIKRRIPSALDVSFGVFANNHVVPLLAERMQDKTGRRLRDGLPYQHNLAAARNVVDGLHKEMWQDSIYTEWLACLRELSKPTTDKKYPEAMRTQAWAMKTTTTQLASWTQLRHDTVLYAKPSYSSGATCYYPAGFVEPVPHFWRRFEQMVHHTKKFIEDNPYAANKWDHKRHLYNLKHFAKTATMLRTIAEKQPAQKALNKEETKFLREIVVRDNLCGAPPISGWYPNLFNKRSDNPKKDDAHKWVALVTDVHTDPPDPFAKDPGCVLHQGVGNVDLLLIAVDNGKDRMVYAGPVFSYYEFETPNAVRRTNGEWQERLRRGRQPSRPAWTRNYLATGVNPDAKNYSVGK